MKRQPFKFDNEYVFSFAGSKIVYEFCDDELEKIIVSAIINYRDNLRLGSMGMKETKRKKIVYGQPD